MTSKLEGLNIEEILKLLDANGPLSHFFKGFEPRKQQSQMMRDILKAYNKSEIALIEAGTGTGKSLAYLIPALLWQQRFKERTVISTNTINLQEQLLNKDIPLLTRALNIECKPALVKGMGNYICLRKFNEAKQELPLMSSLEISELELIEEWLDCTQDGSRSSLSIVPSAATWEKVGAEHDTCNHKDCPHYKECFYFKARKAASEANILIVNHHLLCYDLVSRNEEEKEQETTLLPHYTRVILDEAHHFEEIATDFFAAKISQMGLLRTLSRLSSEKQGKPSGKLNLLLQQIYDCYRKGDPKEVSQLLNRLNIDLPSQRWEVRDLIDKACDAFQHFAKLMASGLKSEEDIQAGEVKLRLLPYHQTHPFWINQIDAAAKGFMAAIEKYGQALDALVIDTAKIKNEKLNEMTKSTLFDIKALTNRLQEGAVILKEFIAPEIPINKVRWIEFQLQRSSSNTSLLDAKLDISSDLAKYLFNRMNTTILVSATLTTNQSFAFIRKRLGLTPEWMEARNINESIYEAPFDYEQQALFAIPTNLPSPSHPAFTQAAAEAIWKAIQASRGNAFILFTSYSLLKGCYDLLYERLKEQRFNPMKQGDTNRQALINQFKKTDRSVLFGTDSFWEGVDVAGEALRCVIIVKLPFKVPTEPMTQARSEAILANDGDPFFDYALPTAIVKFKQGCGRLIRNKKDRGCILCLDNRLLLKSYGRLFLNSLPPCRQLFVEMDELQKQMEDFYRRTYHLTKS